MNYVLPFGSFSVRLLVLSFRSPSAHLTVVSCSFLVSLSVQVGFCSLQFLGRLEVPPRCRREQGGVWLGGGGGSMLVELFHFSVVIL